MAETTTGGRTASWYEDAVIYELHVRAFADSNGDGIGDFRGLTARLDYLQDLGVTALWLLPFYPSPLRDGGYDIADYTAVNPEYGTLADFKRFLKEAHARGLKVITELVLNHTSDQHPWFQRARTSPPGSRARDFYVWSDTPDRYTDARIIFKDFEPSNWSWDPVAKQYFWHRFYSHQPDLNFENPAVRRAMFRVIDFWLKMGVDGVRLDAVPYLHEREGTSCENLTETHGYLKELRAHVDEKFEGRMLLAEANQWPEDSVAYFGDGDECHMAFHFPVMPRLFMAVHMEDRFPIVEILKQTPPIPDGCQWATFLRNHDELTLEMVTDEERDYMYRVYGEDPRMRINLGIRRRLAPLLGNNRRQIELLNGLLLSLGGTPVIYYGDEIGMGDNIFLGDRDGVRTPMQWSPDRNAGFSQANPQRLYLPVVIDPEYHAQAINVEAQQRNSSSILWWMKRLIALRQRHRAFARGTTEIVGADNPHVLAFVREHGDEQLLVVANLSRFTQRVELDLAPHAGDVPVELFGLNRFPPVTEEPYFLTLGPHNFFWFELRSPTAGEDDELPRLQVDGDWRELLGDGRWGELEPALVTHLARQRWYAGKARTVRSASLLEAIPLAPIGVEGVLALVRVDYTKGAPDIYTVPLRSASGAEARMIAAEHPGAAVAELERSGAAGDDGPDLLYGALVDPETANRLLAAFASRRRLKGSGGRLRFGVTPAFAEGYREPRPEPRFGDVEQSNTNVVYGDRFVLKMFRRLATGTNPDLEIGRFLVEKAGFEHVPPVAGAIEYVPDEGETLTVGLLQRFVPNEGDAWRLTLDELGRYLERALARSERGAFPKTPELPLLERADMPVPEEAREAIGGYLESARLLGRRIGELHVALTSPRSGAFAPERFTGFYLRSIYQSARNGIARSFTLLRDRLRELPPNERRMADELLEAEDELLARFATVLELKPTARRSRIHGDLHLGQVLSTGDDFVVIDFEGEPERPISERRIKRSPLRDVAGMLRSFHYAMTTAIRDDRIRPRDRMNLAPWVDLWLAWVTAAFTGAYLEAARAGGFLPESEDELRALLELFVLDKAVYELGYELNNRPAWVGVPLRGLLRLLHETGEENR